VYSAKIALALQEEFLRRWESIILTLSARYIIELIALWVSGKLFLGIASWFHIRLRPVMPAMSPLLSRGSTNLPKLEES